MEKSITNGWLQDERGLARTDCGQEMYLLDQESVLSSIQPSSPFQFPNSSPTTSSGDTFESYPLIDSYLRPLAWKSMTSDPMRRSMSQLAIEQLLLCKEAQNGLQSNFSASDAWELHQQVDLATAEEPLHQLPGWSQHGIMEDWQEVPSASQMESSSINPAVAHLNEHLTVEMPLSPTTMDLNQVNHFYYPGIVNLELYSKSQQLSSSSEKIQEGYAAKRKAARRNRILNMRQKSAPHQRGSHGEGTTGTGSPRGLRKMFSNKIPRELLTSIQRQGRNMDSLRFLLHKVLQPSDVSSLGRIIISKKEAETHLPYLAMKEGIFITMEDFDTSVQWTFRYRFWPNNKSRMYLLESTGEFIRAHQLKRGDILVLWRNSAQGTFVIRGRKSNRDDGDGIADFKDAAKEMNEEALMKVKSGD